MGKKFLLALLVLVTIVSCNNKNKNQYTPPIDNASANTQGQLSISQGGRSLRIAEGWRFDTLVFDNRIHIDNDTAKDGMKIEIDFEYPIAVPEGINLQKIQHCFAQIFLGKDDFRGTPHDAFDTIVNNYTFDAVQYGIDWEQEENEFIDFSIFEQTKSVSIEHISKYLVTVSSGHYQFLGGAHGAYFLSYDNIDLRDGSIITEEQLFASDYSEKLDALIQKEVTRRNDSPDEDEHIALLVDTEEIKPNRNFFFSEEGIVYIYNQYEISPYVQGVVEIIVPYDEIKPLINQKYMEIIENIQSEK